MANKMPDKRGLRALAPSAPTNAEATPDVPTVSADLGSMLPERRFRRVPTMDVGRITSNEVPLAVGSTKPNSKINAGIMITPPPTPIVPDNSPVARPQAT